MFRPRRRGEDGDQCDQIGRFCNFLAINIVTKVAQICCIFLAYFESDQWLVKIATAYSGQLLDEIWATFYFAVWSHWRRRRWRCRFLNIPKIVYNKCRLTCRCIITPSISLSFCNFFKKWAIIYLYYRLFYELPTVNMFNNSCQWLDLNPGPRCQLCLNHWPTILQLYILLKPKWLKAMHRLQFAVSLLSRLLLKDPLGWLTPRCWNMKLDMSCLKWTLETYIIRFWAVSLQWSKMFNKMW